MCLGGQCIVLKFHNIYVKQILFRGESMVKYT